MSEELKKFIGEKVGQATACWDNLEGAGVFQSEKASEILDEIFAAIDKENEVLPVDLTDLPVKFAASFVIHEDQLDAANDPRQYFMSEKTKQLANLGSKIDQAKKDIWQDRKNLAWNTREYVATLYIFSLNELKSFKQSIINQTKKEVSDGQEGK